MSGAVWFEVWTGDRPMSLNAERPAHWSVGNRATQEWKDATIQALSRAKLMRHRFVAVDFSYEVVYPDAVLTDTGNTYPTLKAIVDAVCDVEILPADNPYHKRRILFEPPAIDRSLDYPVVRIRMVPAEPQPDHGAGQCECGARHQAELFRQQMRAKR